MAALASAAFAPMALNSSRTSVISSLVASGLQKKAFRSGEHLETKIGAAAEEIITVRPPSDMMGSTASVTRTVPKPGLAEPPALLIRPSSWPWALICADAATTEASFVTSRGTTSAIEACSGWASTRDLSAAAPRPGSPLVEKTLGDGKPDTPVGPGHENFLGHTGLGRRVRAAGRLSAVLRKNTFGHLRAFSGEGGRAREKLNYKIRSSGARRGRPGQGVARGAMEGKDLLLELEDQNALLEQHVANKEHEISRLREQLRQRELALEAFVSPLKQTPMPERGSAAGSGRVQELSSRIHSLENERQALKRENKALQEIDVRKSKALDQLDRTIKSLEEERDVQKLAHAQEIAKLKARVGEAHALTRRHDELERAHAALAEECAALQAADNLRVKDWMAERRRLKEEVRVARLYWLPTRTFISAPTEAHQGRLNVRMCSRNSP
eukprot:scaffold6259_cov122-Isochrysis_galbana.AAC.6